MRDDSLILPRPTDPMPDDRLIERYVAGECTLPERVAIDRWIAVHPAWGVALTAMRHDGESEREGRVEPIDEITETQQLLTRVCLQIQDTNREHESELLRGRHGIPAPRVGRVMGMRLPIFHRNVSRRVTYGAMASGLVLLITLVTLLGWPRSAVSPGVPVSTYTTGNGERATIKLPDGSIVALNVASRLDVPVDYLTGHRTLRLEGQAMFSVVARSGAPFTVEAGGTVTRVLGTHFAVRHYETDSSTVIAVRDGKVSVRSTVLAAAQRAEVLATGKTVMTPVEDMQNTFSDDVLTLHGVLLSDAITDLNRWYDVDVRLGDPSLAVRRLDAKLDSGSPADLQAILELTFGVRVVRDGRILTLYSGR